MPRTWERPGTGSYDSGFGELPGAEHPGTNDRGQLHRRAIHGRVPIGRALKYYARYAGVSGIHDRKPSVFR